MEPVKAGMQGAVPNMAVGPAKTYDAPASAVFLEELRYRARKYGHDGDYVAVMDFLNALYREAHVPTPNLEPFPQGDK
jgi:hypothetical protein